MPLDAEDYRRLQDMIDRTVPRVEYENRHITMVQRITKLEENHAEMARYILVQFEKAALAREESFKESMKAIQGVQDSVQELKDNLSEKQGLTLRSIVGYLVTFLVGGGALAIVEYIRGFK